MAFHEKDLTVKQRRYIRLLAESNFDKSKKKECALQAGYSPNNIGNTVSNLNKNRSVNELIKLKMEEKGLTLDYLVDKQKEILESEHPKYEGKPDTTNRRLALDMAYNIIEAYGSQKIDINKSERKEVIFGIEDYRLAEEITGEKIIDVEPEQEEIKVEPLY